MSIHATPPPPALHRPSTPGDFATPPPVVAEESAEQAEALSEMEASDRLAELAGMDPEALKRIKQQEWGKP